MGCGWKASITVDTLRHVLSPIRLVQRGQVVKRRWLVLIGCFAVALSGLYLMTAQVYSEGSLGESYLMLKPSPSIENGMGGGEDGEWARSHPNQPPPWWQSDGAVKLLWGGDWEGPILWPLFYGLGYLLTPILWLVLVVGSLMRMLRRRGLARS
jgi:hypothetical protein